MPRKRRSYPAELKAKVALEALRGGSDDGGAGGPLQCASEPDCEEVLASFSGNHEWHEASRETEIKELRAKIGELVIDRDFLSKAFGR